MSYFYVICICRISPSTTREIEPEICKMYLYLNIYKHFIDWKFNRTNLNANLFFDWNYAFL